MLVRLAARVAALLGAAATVVAAQTREVTGRVTEAGSGTPLTQASVGVLGSPLVVRTNDRGEYRLRAASGPVTILARAIGFKRATANGAFVGLIAGMTAVGLAATYTDVAFLWHNVTGAVAAVTAGLIVSALDPKKPKQPAVQPT